MGDSGPIVRARRPSPSACRHACILLALVAIHGAPAPSIHAVPPARSTTGGEIHLFGGESQARKASLATVERRDDRARRWVRLPPMPTARNFARAVPFKGAVLVVGGNRDAGNSHGSSGSAVVERYRRAC